MEKVKLEMNLEKKIKLKKLKIYIYTYYVTYIFLKVISKLDLFPKKFQQKDDKSRI